MCKSIKTINQVLAKAPKQNLNLNPNPNPKVWELETYTRCNGRNTRSRWEQKKAFCGVR